MYTRQVGSLGMARNRAMLNVQPETRGEARGRKGERTYDEYLNHLFELEDKFGEHDN